MLRPTPWPAPSGAARRARVPTVVRVGVTVVRRYLRCCPGTVAFLVVLVVTDVVVQHVLPPQVVHRLLPAISTNTANLRHRPLVVLPASALVCSPELFSWRGALFAVFGVAGCLAWIERTAGTLRAVAVFLAGHVGATLVTAGVITLATAHGWYPAQVRHTVDYGISYGALAAVGAVTPLLPTLLRPIWAAAALLWPLPGAVWFGPVPDFTTVGHLASAVIGLGCGVLLYRHRSAPPKTSAAAAPPRTAVPRGSAAIPAAEASPEDRSPTRDGRRSPGSGDHPAHGDRSRLRAARRSPRRGRTPPSTP